MVEQAIIFSLALPAFLLVYIAFKMKDKHSVMKIFLTGMSMVFMTGIPFTGYMLAEESGYTDIASYLIYFELVIIVTLILFVFYLIWYYIEDVLKIISGSEDRLNQDL